MIKDAATLVRYYEEGRITHHELFTRVRELGLADQLPFRLQEDYQNWSEDHPPGGLSGSIFA